MYSLAGGGRMGVNLCSVFTTKELCLLYTGLGFVISESPHNSI